MKRCLAGLFLLLVLMVPGRADEPATSSPEDGVPAARLAQLSRGVNLGAWFCWYKGPQPAKYDHTYLENHLTPADFDAIKKASFTFVRFPVNYELFLDEDHPDTLRSEFLGDLDLALDRLFAAGLAVDIDWHATDETWARLRDDDAFAAKAEIFMGAVAKHLSRRDPERLFLETVNEPIKGVTNKRWEPIQDKMLRLMRANAPAHTLIAEGVDFSNIDGLVQLKPVAVGNIVYNFHFYTWIFTHQGSWEKRIHDLVGLDYPVNEANKAQVVARMSDPEGRKWAAKFHETRQTLTAEIGQAVAWGQRYHVPLLCNEFGVFKHGATEPSRLRWIRDVREILEADHIGWCIWTYDDSSFGITDPDKSGRNILEPATLKALGLESGPAQ